MSFILDALKKLEQEKAARRSGEINISAEIIRDNRQMRRKVKRSVPVSAVLVAFGLLILSGASGAFLWHKQAVKKQGTVVALTPERMPPAVVEETDPQERAMAGPAAPPARPVAAVATGPAPRPVESKGRMQGKQIKAHRPVSSDLKARSDEPAREDSGPKGSGITVSGIAWQDAPAARRAVINGDLVEEGAQVGGATVEEIMPTKVRFSSGGRRFSVSISGPLVAK
jgi:general secretion pathway protein B